MKTTFTVKGTHCQSCAMLIKDIASDITGIKSCSVDVKSGKTVIDHEPTADLKRLKKEIEEAGKYKIVI